MPRPPSADAPRIFTGIAHSYDRVGALLSFGQDPRWRHALVDAVDAGAGDLILDVATGTGLVAMELARRYGCTVVGLDRSADMLAEAAGRNGLIAGLVNARAERLPFPDATFDHVTFTYLLRYVDEPAATLSELARVLKPGGRLAALEFGVPSSPWAFALWRVYTRLVMPIAGSLVSRKWREVNAFGLAVGVAAHSFDELQGRPLGTRIPARVLVALGALGLAGAAALGIAAVAMLGPAFGLFVAAGIALVLLYAFEAPLVHSDLGFALAWGAFPVLTAAYATGAPPLPAVAVAAAAALLSLAQRVLSTRVRAVRRRSASVEGEVRYRDGSRETLDAESLIAAPEGALRILWLAVVALAVGLLLSRYL